MSTPYHQAHPRSASGGDRTGAVDASRASMRRELARAGHSAGASGPAHAAPTATSAKAGDPQANMRRQLARAGIIPSSIGS